MAYNAIVIITSVRSHQLNIATFNMRKQARPSTVKTQIALERATHKRTTHGSSTPNYRKLLGEVLVIIVLRGAPPRSIVLYWGRGSSPLQWPIRQNSKCGK